MTTHDANHLLQKAYVFTQRDFAENCEGRLSERQVASLRAGRFGARIAAVLFIVVMLGTVALVVGSSIKSTLDVSPLVMVSLVFVVTVSIAVSLFLSLKYVRPLHSRAVKTAVGLATDFVADVERNTFRLRIGDTTLRISSAEQLCAFLPDMEYRVHYLPGAMPLILSAATADAAAIGSSDRLAANSINTHAHAFKRSILMAVLIAILALAIPALAIFGDLLPAKVRQWGWLALVFFSIIPVVVMLWSRWFRHRD